MLQKVNELHEMNPMLGLRGVRLGIVEPGLYAMQVRAIVEAAVEVKKAGHDLKVEIMIPLVATAPELQQMLAELEPVATEILEREDVTLDHLEWGTMIELPRAAVTAGEIAESAEFSRSARTTSRRPRSGSAATTSASSSGCTRSASSCRRTRSSRSTGRAWGPDADRGRGGEGGESLDPPGDLRRARRRPRQRGLLSRARARLRELLAVPGGDGASGGGPGGGGTAEVASK